jgi:hypothetical protein
VLERQQGCRVAMGPSIFCFSQENSTFSVVCIHEHCQGNETRCFLLKFLCTLFLEVITQSGKLSHSVSQCAQSPHSGAQSSH